MAVRNPLTKKHIKTLRQAFIDGEELSTPEIVHRLWGVTQDDATPEEYAFYARKCAGFIYQLSGFFKTHLVNGVRQWLLAVGQPDEHGRSRYKLLRTPKDFTVASFRSIVRIDKYVDNHMQRMEDGAKQFPALRPKQLTKKISYLPQG